MDPRKNPSKSSTLSKPPSLFKKVYRFPFDKLEEITTGESDLILANSEFTARVYQRAFPSLAKGKKPFVVYPCIDVEAYTRGGTGLQGDDSVEMIRR